MTPKHHSNLGTLPETNIAPENGWLDAYFPFGRPIFKGYVSFREGNLIISLVFPHEWPVFGTVSMIYRYGCQKFLDIHDGRVRANFSLNFTGPQPWSLCPTFRQVHKTLGFNEAWKMRFWDCKYHCHECQRFHQDIDYHWSSSTLGVNDVLCILEFCGYNHHILYISYVGWQIAKDLLFNSQASLLTNRKRGSFLDPWDSSSCDSISLHQKGWTKSSNPNLAGKTTKC